MLTGRLPRRARGFNLIELMVTVAILSMLLMAVIPGIGAWSRNMQIRDTAESIQTGLQRTRQEAVTQNRIVRFNLVNSVAVLDNSCALSSTGRSWVVSFDDPATKCGEAPSATDAPRIIAKNAGGGGNNSTATVSALNSDNTAATWVAFDNYGRVQSGSTSIARIDVSSTVSDEQRPLRIVITNAGGIRMCDPAVSSTTDPRKC